MVDRKRLDKEIKGLRNKKAEKRYEAAIGIETELTFEPELRGDTKTVTELLKVLSDDDVQVRAAVASALSLNNESAGLRQLLEDLSDDSDDDVEYEGPSREKHATQANRSYHAAQGVYGVAQLVRLYDLDLSMSDAVSEIGKALRGRPEGVSAYAARALGEIGGAEAISLLTDALAEPYTQLDTNVAVADALAPSGNAKAREMIKDAGRDPNVPWVQRMKLHERYPDLVDEPGDDEDPFTFGAPDFNKPDPDEPSFPWQ